MKKLLLIAYAYILAAIKYISRFLYSYIYIALFFVVLGGFVSFLPKNSVYAQAPVELNSTNITQAPFNCPTSAIFCDLSNKNIGSIAANTFNQHNNLQSLYLQENQLTTIPTAALSFLGSSLTELSLGGNQITSIAPDTFAGLNLNSLDLGYNQITSIDEDAFDGLIVQNLSLQENQLSSIPTVALSALGGSLMELGLGGNQITSIAPDTFAGLNLNLLDLGGNQITSIASDAFTGLIVQNLSLQENQLTTIPTVALSALASDLITLDLGGNQITSIASDAFDGLIVQNLYLYNNQLTTIPTAALSSLGGSLMELGLGGNQITSIAPDTFAGLNLNLLDLGGNQITSIDEDAFDGLIVQNLYLYDNQLTSIPTAALSSLGGSLTGLFLGGNQITSIPSNAFAGLNLNLLDLQSNQISTIASNAFAGLNTLRGLTIEYNNISNIQGLDFSGLDSIRTINLGGNMLHTLPYSSLNTLDTLEELILQNNQIRTMASIDISDLENLRFLNIASNQITSIESVIFTDIYNLEGLSINNNHIYDVQQNAFNWLPNIQEIYINNNPIVSIFVGAFPSTLESLSIDNTCTVTPITITHLGGSSTTDNLGCARITGGTPTAYNNNLNSRGYALQGGFWEGTLPLSFNGGQNTIHSATRMISTNINGYAAPYYQHPVQVEYPALTEITINNSPYINLLTAPFLFHPSAVQNISGVLAITRFGSLTASIDFSQNITVRIPVVNADINDQVDIYTSPDGQAWSLHTSTTVTNQNGIPYVVFTTNHATYFAVTPEEELPPPPPPPQGDITCTLGNFNLGTQQTSLTGYIIQAIASQAYSCNDTLGTSANALQMTIPLENQITNGITTIPNNNVSINNPSGTVSQGCAGGVQSLGTAFQSFGSGTIDIIQKNNPNDTCSYAITPQIRIEVPARVTVGSYIGTIIVTFPQ